MRDTSHRRRVLCAIVVFAVLAGPLATAVPAAAAPEPPHCTVALDRMSAIAEPSSTSGDIVTFTGSVQVSLGFLTGSRTVQIVAVASPDTWAAAVEPASQQVTGAATINFNATLAVPAQELTTTPGRITITASFHWVPGTEDPTEECSNQANIQVAQYFAVNADALTPRVKVTAGPRGEPVSVLVHNLGNGRDIFRVELENRADLEVRGIVTTLPQTATLSADQKTNLTFSVNVSTSVEPGEYELYIMVTSQTDPTIRRDTQITIEAELSIIDELFDPTVIVVLGGVGAAGIGGLLAVRSRRTRKRARLAKRQLDRIRRQQRKAAAPDGGGRSEQGGQETGSGGADAPARDDATR